MKQQNQFFPSMFKASSIFLVPQDIGTCGTMSMQSVLSNKTS